MYLCKFGQIHLLVQKIIFGNEASRRPTPTPTQRRRDPHQNQHAPFLRLREGGIMRSDENSCLGQLKLMKRDGSNISKIRLKHAVDCLGFVMLQLSNCCLEDLKTWSTCNISWDSIPVGNSQWKEGVFVVVLTSMDLSDNSWRSFVWAGRSTGHLQFCRRGTNGPQVVSQVCQFI